MTHLPTSIRKFTSIEELDELPRELGWPLEYRQIEPGSFSSTFTDVDGVTWFLMEEQSSRRVEIEAAAPEGMFMLAIFEGNPGVVNGKSCGENHIFLQAPGSSFLCTIPAGLKATQVGIAEEQFDKVIRAIAPDVSIRHGDTAVFDAPPDQLANVRWAMRSAILAPSVRESTRDEATSSILADLIATAFDQGEAQLGRELHRAAARRVLNRAKEYIEAHVGEAIQISSLCSYSGTSLRSLERIFSRELGVTPKQYVVARRLNAVRRRLLAAEEQELRVTDVAQDHGFAHLGRFAGEYRSYFGESPRETLQSS